MVSDNEWNKYYVSSVWRWLLPGMAMHQVNIYLPASYFTIVTLTEGVVYFSTLIQTPLITVVDTQPSLKTMYQGQ